MTAIHDREEIERQRGYKVVKSNEIIQRARYELSITELKTLAFIISKIRPTDTALQEYSFQIRDYCQVCGIECDNGGNYQHMKATLKGLSDRSFWLREDNGQEVLCRWIQKVRINRGSGKVTVRLDEDMHKHVIGLFCNFTCYELLSTLPMKSAYSFRIYELLKSYAFKGSHVFDIDELKRMIAAEHLKNFKDFRRRVLEYAVKEINMYTDIEVSWEPLTHGRKVIQVRFEITQRDTWGRYMAGRRAHDEMDGGPSVFDLDYYK